MRVLWVTNQPIAKLREMLNVSVGQSGGWMETSYEAIKLCDDIELGIATIYSGNDLKIGKEGRHRFYGVPSKQTIGDYQFKDPYNIEQWSNVIADFQPCLIQLWGTENPTALCALYASKEIMSVVYMQGMLSQIYNHYCDGVNFREQLRYLTICDLKNMNFFWRQKAKFREAALREEKILHLSKKVIIENDWCANNCSSIEPEVTAYKSLLPVNPVFAKYDWNIDNVEPHSIFTVAGGYPIKGHHVLLKAFVQVVKRYPDAKLYVPGATTIAATSFKSKLRRNTYDNLIMHLVKQYDLEKNIVYTGKLTAEEMAKRISKSHVYVMPSSCENHSSSLIEAMIVGVPTVSSYVGGLSGYYKDSVNGFFYRFDEPEVLAAIICNYFENPEMAKAIAETGKREQRQARLNIDLQKDFVGIYKEILSRS